jgi:Flp pilus assembly CpaF family ATPase
MSVTRVLIGEVRGDEALPMLEAMNAGMPGSMCTLHAGNAADAMERLVTAALKGAGQGWSSGFVTRLAAQGIDYVIHLRHIHHPEFGQVRFVSEIAEVTDVTETGVIAMNRVFAPARATGDPRGRFGVAPQQRGRFDEAGVSLDALHAPDVDRWAVPRRAL